MADTDTDAVERISSTVIDEAVAAETSPAPEAESETTSTDTGDTSPEAEFSKRVSELEEGRKRPAAPPPTETEEPDSEQANADDASKDGKAETTKDNDEPAESSQESEFTKRFTERPEWKATQKLVAPGKEKAMRGIMRGLYQKENALAAQVEKFKPAATALDRIRKRVGEDGVENSIRLIESWHDGTPEAEKMLEELLTDLKARRGTALSSPELVQEADELDKQLADGLITKEWRDKRRNELMRLQQSEARVRQTEAEKRKALEEAGQQTVKHLVAERTAAIDSWESEVAKRDPDYPKLQKTIIQYAKAMISEKQGNNKPLLTSSEMVEIMQTAYLEAKKDVMAWMPKPKARVPVVGGNPSGNNRPAPKDEREAFFRRIDELEARR